MKSQQDFVDFYKALQVDPDCDPRTLELAYHHLAKLYHPDNPTHADVDKFTAATEAYAVLRDAERRAEYDAANAGLIGKPLRAVSSAADFDEEAAVNDAEVRDRILLQLYKRRREDAANPGVVTWYLQESLGISDEALEFHAWYLKAKDLIEITEQGTMAITIAGVDEVISTSRATLRDKLLLADARPPRPSEPAPD